MAAIQNVRKTSILIGFVGLLGGWPISANPQPRFERIAQTHTPSPILTSQQSPTTPDNPDLAEAERLNQQAKELYDQGQYAAAIILIERALVLRENVLGSNHPDVAETLNNLGLLYHTQGKYAQAERLYQRALAIRENVLGSDHPDVAQSFNNLAGLYQDQGKYAQAEPLYQQSLAIRERLLGADHPFVATSLNNLAALYQDQGKYTQAEPLYQRALAIREQVLGADHPDFATSLNNLAVLYQDQGKYAQAEPLYQRALAIQEQVLGADHPYLATSLNNLAGLYQDQEQYAQAEPLYQRSLAIVEKVLGADHPDFATSLNNLALLYQDQEQYAQAEPLYQRSLAIREKVLGADHPNVANSLNNLALLYQYQGKYAQAEPLYQRSLAIQEKVLGADHPNVANNLNKLAFLYQAQGNTNRTVEFLTRGINIQEQNLAINLTAGSETDKLAYIATISGTTSRTISLHLQAAPNNLEFARLALTTILQRKGRVLDALADSLDALRRNLTPENQVLLDQLATNRAQLSALIFNKPENLSPEEYRQQVAALKTEAEKLEVELSRRSAQFLTASQPVTIEAVQRLIPADAALVELVLYYPFNPKAARTEQWGTPHYAAYILHSQGEPEWVDLGEATAIDEAWQQFRPILTDVKKGSPAIKAKARALDALLMQPIRQKLGNSRHILLSPDSQLNLIPFAALVDENDQYLVENYTITYLTTGRDLLRLSNHAPSQENPVLMANPDFDNPGSSSPTQVASATRSSESQRSTDLARFQVGALPGTAEEAKAIAPLLSGITLLTGSQATENTLKQVQSPSILHIATHGFFLQDLPMAAPRKNRGGIEVEPIASPTSSSRISNPENPLLRSGIALAGFNPRQSGSEDGVLTALEAAGLNLYGTKLVALSACETGLGDATNGDGVYGLRRAFVIAGAESQLMSMWKVSDFGTKDLMLQYYQRILKGEGRSEALRQTQLTMLQSQQYKHPYYWAAFIPSGDWTPAQF